MRNKKILLVDDEQDVLDFLVDIFENKGFITETARDGIQAIKKIKNFTPDIYILDMKMPNLEGDALCSYLRTVPEYKTTPIIFLSAQNTEDAEMRAFNAGANDFIAKPIRPQSLLARVKKSLENTNYESNFNNEKNLNLSKITQVGEFKILHEEYLVLIDDKSIHFPKKEFQIIELLAHKQGKVIERKELFRKIWGSDLIMDDRTIDVHIRKIRAKTSDDFIKTVKGVGFKI